MAYVDQEGSVQDGAPYFLYEFNVADTTYRFTDTPTNLTWNSVLWEAFPITHTEVKQSNELSKNSIKIAFPMLGVFADRFIGWTPDTIITFTLYRGHFGSTDTLVHWKGRISSHKLKDQTIELACESIFTSMRRPGIRARYQRSCRHALYSPGCNLDKDDFVLANNEITTIAGLTLTVQSAAGVDPGWFTGGVALFSDGSYRMIVNHETSMVTLDRAVRVLSEAGYGLNYGNYYGGVGVSLYPGCDRTLATCKDKFDNLLNNGSFKWIPSKNPMSGSSII